MGQIAPYNISKFQSFISECKLQAPTSATIATAAQLAGGYASEDFYVVDPDKMAFTQTGASMRTELRHETNWQVQDGDRILQSRVKIYEQTCDQVTFLQIHDDANAGSGPNKPLLRVYRHLVKTPSDHLWAAIKTDPQGVNTQHYDLGETPADYFDCTVSIESGQLNIYINGQKKATLDVTFWTFPSYWKAGVYLQDEGRATAYFDQLYLENTSETPLSLSENELASISIYPNPASSSLKMDMHTREYLQSTLTISNSTGKILQKMTVTEPAFELSLPQQRGLYLLSFEKDGKNKVFKIVKK